MLGIWLSSETQMHLALRSLTCMSLSLLLSALALADVNTPAAGDSFQIENAARPGDLLRVKDARSADGTPLVLYPKQAWKCMTWELQADGEAFRLRNHFTNKTLAPITSPTTQPADASTPVVQRPLDKEPSPFEAWRFEPIADTEGLVRVVHVESGQVLEADGNGNVVLKKSSDAPTQRWRLLPKPEKFTG